MSLLEDPIPVYEVVEDDSIDPAWHSAPSKTKDAFMAGFAAGLDAVLEEIQRNGKQHLARWIKWQRYLLP